jgi:hypothetical protein
MRATAQDRPRITPTSPQNPRALRIVDPGTGITERCRFEVKGLTKAFDAGVMRRATALQARQSQTTAKIKP